MKRGFFRFRFLFLSSFFHFVQALCLFSNSKAQPKKKTLCSLLFSIGIEFSTKISDAWTNYGRLFGPPLAFTFYNTFPLFFIVKDKNPVISLHPTRKEINFFAQLKKSNNDRTDPHKNDLMMIDLNDDDGPLPLKENVGIVSFLICQKSKNRFFNFQMSKNMSLPLYIFDSCFFDFFGFLEGQIIIF